MPEVRKIALPIASMFIGLLVAFAFLEVIFRVLPTSDSLYMQPVNDANPIGRAAPNRKVVLSQGWNFNPLARKRTNNFGFLNDQDYSRSDTSPLLAVIGDSYVEATQVASASALHGILAASVADTGRVYSFGFSGAALSQYVMSARYAVEEFGARYVVIVVVGNDFDESLFSHKQGPGHHYFIEGSDGLYQLTRVDYAPSRLKRVLKLSAFMRYLFINLRLSRQMLAQWNYRFNTDAGNEFAGNTSASVEQNRIGDSKIAVDEFLRHLPMETGIPAERILLVIDGIRPQLYEEEMIGSSLTSYFGLMRTYLIAAAGTRGIETLDLQPAFREDFERRRLRFEFPTDSHWNEQGHAVAAKEIATSSVFHRFRNESRPANPF